MAKPNEATVKRLEEFSEKIERAVGTLVDKAAEARTGDDAAGFAQAASMLTPTLVQVAHAIAHDADEDQDVTKEFMH